jgi:hypothetical protein
MFMQQYGIDTTKKWDDKCSVWQYLKKQHGRLATERRKQCWQHRHWLRDSGTQGLRDSGFVYTNVNVEEVLHHRDESEWGCKARSKGASWFMPPVMPVTCLSTSVPEHRQCQTDRGNSDVEQEASQGEQQGQLRENRICFSFLLSFHF